jgi:serine/threonine-protein kinase
MVEPSFGALSVGHRFHGRYQIVRCLKAGGMGAVYEVLDEKTRRRRALKIMLPTSIQDADLRARFGLEATITAGVESDHIVETFDADIDVETGSPFIVMELLKGEDLGAVLDQRGRLPAAEVVQLLGQLAHALDKTHAAGIIHRDLKPENLFVTRADDGAPRLKVLDFGIAKVMAQSAVGAKTTRVMGTPLYMSKEQITGDGAIGPAADLYSLAHIAYTLLTGQAYWYDEAQTAAAQYAFLSTVLLGAKEPATARAARRGVTLPAAFDPWFLRATALEAELRFDRASSLVNALAQALDVPRLAPSSAAVDGGLGAQPGLPGVAPVVEGRRSAPAPPSAAARAVTPVPQRGPFGTQPSTPSAAALASDRAVPGVAPKRPLWAIPVAVVGVAALGLTAIKLAKPASGAPDSSSMGETAKPLPEVSGLVSPPAPAPSAPDRLAPGSAPTESPAVAPEGSSAAVPAPVASATTASPASKSTAAASRPTASPARTSVRAAPLAPKLHDVDDPTKIR